MPDFSRTYSASFLDEVAEIAARLDRAAIEAAATLLASVREEGGRLFILGVGGSAANASHAVNDFRKLVGLEAYSPTDNVSELTARTNDEGWATVFVEWLRVSRLARRDAVMVFSVGGGNSEKNVSPNIVAAVDYAKSTGARILGVVGRDGGHTGRSADVCVLIPSVSAERITPHAEAFQAVIWHLLVSHPLLQRKAARWESLAAASGRRKAVFLDRDGVLVEAVMRDGMPYAPDSAREMRIPPGTAETLTRLKSEGFLLLVVTNQPDVARGRITLEDVEGIHRRLRQELPVDDVFTCLHDDKDGCNCRKPRPGLLLQGAAQYDVDLSRSYMVGDRWRDVEAGANAGCKSVWIDRGYKERAPAVPPAARVGSLVEAAEWILQDASVPAKKQ